MVRILFPQNEHARLWSLHSSRICLSPFAFTHLSSATQLLNRCVCGARASRQWSVIAGRECTGTHCRNDWVCLLVWFYEHERSKVCISALLQLPALITEGRKPGNPIIREDTQQWLNASGMHKKIKQKYRSLEAALTPGDLKEAWIPPPPLAPQFSRSGLRQQPQTRRRGVYKRAILKHLQLLSLPWKASCPDKVFPSSAEKSHLTHSWLGFERGGVSHPAIWVSSGLLWWSFWKRGAMPMRGNVVSGSPLRAGLPRLMDATTNLKQGFRCWSFPPLKEASNVGKYVSSLHRQFKESGATQKHETSCWRWHRDF